MYRSTWELATYVRYHIAALADERRACSPITQSAGRSKRPVTQVRQRLGLGLIKIGEILAGYEAVRGLPKPPARPVPWGASS